MYKPCECCCECHLTVQERRKQHQEEIIQRRNAQKQSLENQKQGLMWGLPRTRALSAVKPSKTSRGTTILIQNGNLDIVNLENEANGSVSSGKNVAIENDSNSYGIEDSRPTVKKGWRFDHKQEIALQQWEKMDAVTNGITATNGSTLRGRSNSVGVKRPELTNNSITRPTISSQRRSVSSSRKQNTETVTTKATKSKFVLDSPSIVSKQLLSEYKTRCEIAETEVTWLLEIIKEFDPDGTILAEKYLAEKDKSTKLILSCRDCQSSKIEVKSVSLPKCTTKSPFLANNTMESVPDIIFNQQNQAKEDEQIENEQKVTFIETANSKNDSSVNQIPANIFALHNDNGTQYFTSHNQNTYNQQLTSTQTATCFHNTTINSHDLQRDYDVPLDTASSKIPLPQSKITQPTSSATQQPTIIRPTTTIQTQPDPIAEILQTTDQHLKSSLRLNETNSTPLQLNPQQQRQTLPHSTSIPNRQHQQSYSFPNSNQLGGHTNIAAVQHRFSSTTALPTTIRTTANDTFKCRPKVVPTTVDSCTSTTNLIHCNDRVTSTQSLLQDQERNQQTQKHYEVPKQLSQTVAAISGSINRLNFATQYPTPIPSQLASNKMKKTVASRAISPEEMSKSNGNMYRVANIDIANDSFIDAEEDFKLQQQKQREEEEMLQIQQEQFEIQKQEFQQRQILEEKQMLLKQQQIQQQMQLQREQQMLQERLQLIQQQQAQSELEIIRPPQIVVDHHKTPTGSNTKLAHKSIQSINKTSTNYHSSSVSKSTANISQEHGQQHHTQKKKSASNRDQLLAMFQNFLAHSEELENDIRSRQPSRTPSEILLI
ncbi:hypothetical protein HK098_003420 [Nowakowskiella sp. JEL0407]|nr:hypothetical protein HK098_003420 [Nowakowskiella sp. JEL0407]